MADISERVANYVNQTSTLAPIRSAEFDFIGKRNIGFQIATSAFTGTATATVIVEHSFVGGDGLDLAVNWKTLATFSAIVAPGTFPSSEIKTLIDDGIKKNPGAKGRISLSLSGTTPNFSAEVFLGYDVGVTE